MLHVVWVPDAGNTCINVVTNTLINVHCQGFCKALYYAGCFEINTLFVQVCIHTRLNTSDDSILLTQ